MFSIPSRCKSQTTINVSLQVKLFFHFINTLRINTYSVPVQLFRSPHTSYYINFFLHQSGIPKSLLVSNTQAHNSWRNHWREKIIDCAVCLIIWIDWLLTIGFTTLGTQRQICSIHNCHPQRWKKLCTLRDLDIHYVRFT